MAPKRNMLSRGEDSCHGQRRWGLLCVLRALHDILKPDDIDTLIGCSLVTGESGQRQDCATWSHIYFQGTG